MRSVDPQTDVFEGDFCRMLTSTERRRKKQNVFVHCVNNIGSLRISGLSYEGLVVNRSIVNRVNQVHCGSKNQFLHLAKILLAVGTSTKKP